MNFIETKLKGAYVIELNPLEDERGMFARVFCKKEFSKIKHDKEFVQFNHSLNEKKGILRGLHYQEPPFAEIKLIRCIRGALFDVIVDIRKSSSTFLQWTGVELSETNMKMMYVPEGFAHGFQTLNDSTELLYHHTNFYEPSAERGIRYNDSMIGIQWPDKVPIISEKDTNYPLLKTGFTGIEL